MGAHAFPPMALHDQAMRRGPRADEKAPLHGEVLTPEEERLLRGRPPTRALRWCAESLGRGAAVLDVRPLAGGTSSAVHAVDLRDGRGAVRRLVLRRFVRADWLAEEPDLAAQEAVALTIAQAVAVPTPVLVAHDPDADVGHCRMNLAGVLGVEAADRFLALHRSVAGAGDYHPFWDIAAALGGFEDADLDAWTPADEEFLARAVARL
jgi:hypothetical protein